MHVWLLIVADNSIITLDAWAPSALLGSLYWSLLVTDNSMITLDALAPCALLGSL